MATVLSKPNSVGILVFLLEKGGSSKATFVQKALGGRNYDSIKAAISRLEAEGLLTTEIVPGRSKYIQIKLTALGMDVARDLKRANDRVLGLAPEPADNFSASQIEGDKMNGTGDLH